MSFAIALAFFASAAVAERTPVKSLLELRRERVIVQEYDISCAAAALATVLTFQFGDRVTEAEVAQGLIRREEYVEMPELVRMRQGFSLLDMKRYVEQRGYEGIGYGRLNLDDLIERAPIIVPVDFSGYNHFVVFRGLAEGRAVFADPAFGQRTMPVGKFEASWLSSPEFGRVGFVVRPPGQEEEPNRLAPDPRNLSIPPAAVVRQSIPFRAF